MGASTDLNANDEELDLEQELTAIIEEASIGEAVDEDNKSEDGSASASTDARCSNRYLLFLQFFCSKHARQTFLFQLSLGFVRFWAST